MAETTIALIDYLCGHLIGHLPQLRQHHDGHGATAGVIDSIQPEAAPNIHALASALGRAADTYQPAAGINLILAGVRTQITSTTSTRSGR